MCDRVHNARPPPQDPPKDTIAETKGQTEQVTTTSATSLLVMQARIRELFFYRQPEQLPLTKATIGLPLYPNKSTV